MQHHALKRLLLEMFCPGHPSDDLPENCSTADLSNIRGFISPHNIQHPFLFFFPFCFYTIPVPYSISEVQTTDFQNLDFAQVLSQRERKRSGSHHGSEAQPGPVSNCIYLRSQLLLVGKAWIKCAAFTWTQTCIFSSAHL